MDAVSTLMWTYVVVVVVATALFLLYLYLRYEALVEDIKMDTAEGILRHERIWDPDNECG